MKRRAFLAGAAAAGLAASQEKNLPPAFELDDVNLAGIVSGLQKGKWTSSQLTELYLTRIEAIDHNGPRLGAVVEPNPDARKLAQQLDRERKSNHLRGPLHGVPLLLKDNIETGDAMKTTAGSLALAHWQAPQDAAVAARLRAAGALLLGKTNLSEWANFRSGRSTSGWSGRGGQTRNPYALDRNPSGSSSGSAAAVAACLCAGAIGTETDGSVTSPASINGIVGLKPTVGLVSRSGIIPISASQDTAGPMARSVRDAALLLNVIADSPQASTDYTAFLDDRGLRGARIGIARKFFANNAALDRFLSGCVETIKKAGAEVIDPADLPSHGQWYGPEMEVLLYEFKDGLNRYLARLPSTSPVRTLEQLISYNEQHRAVEMPYFGQELFIEAQAKGPLTDDKYLQARAACLRLARAEGIDAALNAHKVDALMTLTSGPAWSIDYVNGDRDTTACTTPAAVAGYPHITVPAGFIGGLPVGLSFFGTAWSEPTLFKLAYAWERETTARRKPAFAPHAVA